jgi:hypothetical protein
MGLLIRPQATALGYSHIQFNPPPHVAMLVFDVDKKHQHDPQREGQRLRHALRTLTK